METHDYLRIGLSSGKVTNYFDFVIIGHKARLTAILIFIYNYNTNEHKNSCLPSKLSCSSEV